ncbi:MAG: hypothetical protein E6I57_11620 [Chloroflexi bacterium]|nr:MAG: hypothetical protein E6I57_11620 [Chloroflexota bacterium]TME87773.1 MAG: hypothetical protein E6I44_08705 [Chloroflexota bacterium]
MGGATAALFALQWLHVLFGVFWLGSQMYSMLVLYPETEKLSAEQDAAIKDALRSGRARRFTLVLAIGTVGLGIIRGIAGGALDRLGEPYGLTFLAAAAVGLYMVGNVLTRGYGNRAPSWAFNTGFAVLFTLMIAMRFGL